VRPASTASAIANQKKHLEETQSANDRFTIVPFMSPEQSGFGKATPGTRAARFSTTRLPYGDFQHLGSRFAALAAALEKEELARDELRAALRQHFSNPATFQKALSGNAPLPCPPTKPQTNS
jgi:hypothetical protein